jgi:aminoglycoside phosphotransferase (APT) family kinase protein
MTATVVTAEFLSGPDGPAWFTQMLARVGFTDVEAGALEVRGVTARPVGTGQVGESIRFTLSYADGLEGDAAPQGRPATVIGKFPSQDPQSRATARMTETYEREFGFYSSLQHRVSIRTPEAHHIAIDPSTGDFTLIMEDLRGSVQGDQLGGCDLGSALLIAEAAAGLHAPTWNVGATLGDVDWLAFPDEATTRDRTALYQAVMPGFIDRYGERIGPDAVAAVEWLSTRLLDLLAAFSDMSALETCVVHNDFRLDNMLFGVEPGSPAVATVDWQTLSAGFGPVDLAYALGSGMLPDQRERHEREVFDRYIAHLGTVPGSKVGAVTEQMRTEMWDAYRLGSTTGLAMAVVASMIVVRTERGDEMFSVMAERHGAQMAALDVFGMLA